MRSWRYKNIRPAHFLKLRRSTYFMQLGLGLLIAKMNFKNRYRNDDIFCICCNEEEDTQQHLLLCKVLQRQLKSDEIVTHNVTYDDIYKDPYRQKVIITIFSKVVRIRETMINKLNPSTPQRVLKKGYNLHDTSVNFSFGKQIYLSIRSCPLF